MLNGRTLSLNRLLTAIVFIALPAIAAPVKETDNWRWWVLIVAVSWIHLLAMRGVL